MKKLSKVLTVIGGATVVSTIGYLLFTKKDRDIANITKELASLGNKIDENISVLDELFVRNADIDLIHVQIREVDDLVCKYNSKIRDAERKYNEDFEMMYGYCTIDWGKDEYVSKVKDLEIGLIDLDVEE